MQNKASRRDEQHRACMLAEMIQVELRQHTQPAGIDTHQRNAAVGQASRLGEHRAVPAKDYRKVGLQTGGQGKVVGIDLGDDAGVPPNDCANFADHRSDVRARCLGDEQDTWP